LKTKYQKVNLDLSTFTLYICHTWTYNFSQSQISFIPGKSHVSAPIFGWSKTCVDNEYSNKNKISISRFATCFDTSS